MFVSEWYREQGCEYPTFIDCMWIWNDKELGLFQNWLDKKEIYANSTAKKIC